MSRRSVTLHGMSDRRLATRWIDEAPLGTIIEFREGRRSQAQNAMLWSLLSDVADQVVWYGEKLDKDDWKDMFTASLRKARVVPGLDPGTSVPLGMRTSDMTREEMSNLIDLIFAFGAERGVRFRQEKPYE